MTDLVTSPLRRYSLRVLKITHREVMVDGRPGRFDDTSLLAEEPLEASDDDDARRRVEAWVTARGLRLRTVNHGGPRELIAYVVDPPATLVVPTAPARARAGGRR